MLTTGITNRLEIPHEPGQWMELRMLSWRDLHQAAEAHTLSVLQTARALGGELYQTIISPGTRDSDGTAPDPMAPYDLELVLKQGVCAWSYPEEVTPDNLGALDRRTAEWAGRAILALNGTGDETERGNATRRSTKH